MSVLNWQLLNLKMFIKYTRLLGLRWALHHSLKWWYRDIRLDLFIWWKQRTGTFPPENSKEREEMWLAWERKCQTLEQ